MNQVEQKEELVNRAVAAYSARFGRRPSWAGIAPGRVNLIGEHTDYNDGLVLPLAIDRWTAAVGGPSAGDDPVSIVRSAELGEEVSFRVTEGVRPSGAAWANYPLGVLRQFQEHGIVIEEMEVLFASSVPVGAGLSSSAALNMAVLRMTVEAERMTLDPMTAARWCQLAEHDFPGVPCGMMDPTASAMGREGHAVLIDCRSSECRWVPMPPGATLLVMNTNVKHDLAGGEYAQRRTDCERALATVKGCGQRVESFRQLSESGLESARTPMGDRLYRRARHVIRENARVEAAAAAMKAGDVVVLGRLMDESHQSLREDFEVSCAELDFLVDAAHDIGRGVYGARMTGGGFGGCAIALVQDESVQFVGDQIGRRYAESMCRSATIFPVRAVSGAESRRL